MTDDINSASLKLIDAIHGRCLRLRSEEMHMTTNPIFPASSDGPSEPDWEDVTDMLMQMRDYLADADMDDGAVESATLINMLLGALDQSKSPEELVCDLLEGIRELCYWWGYLGLPANLQKAVDSINEAVADPQVRELVTFH